MSLAFDVFLREKNYSLFSLGNVSYVLCVVSLLFVCIQRKSQLMYSPSLSFFFSRLFEEKLVEIFAQFLKYFYFIIYMKRCSVTSILYLLCSTVKVVEKFIHIQPVQIYVSEKLKARYFLFVITFWTSQYWNILNKTHIRISYNKYKIIIRIFPCTKS